MDFFNCGANAQAKKNRWSFNYSWWNWNLHCRYACECPTCVLRRSLCIGLGRGFYILALVFRIWTHMIGTLKNHGGQTVGVLLMTLVIFLICSPRGFAQEERLTALLLVPYNPNAVVIVGSQPFQTFDYIIKNMVPWWNTNTIIRILY